MGQRYKKFVIWSSCIGLALFLPLVMYVGLLIAGRDLFSAITKKGPITADVIVRDGSAGRFWFVGQSFKVDTKDYYLPLYPKPLRNETMYRITYFPGSRFVYDVESVSEI